MWCQKHQLHQPVSIIVAWSPPICKKQKKLVLINVTSQGEKSLNGRFYTRAHDYQQVIKSKTFKSKQPRKGSFYIHEPACTVFIRNVQLLPVIGFICHPGCQAY